MTSVEYRRGNLREALVDRAVTVLRERGATALSLRELARDIGVSHAAPSRHFGDRRELLDAVAVEGFTLLAARINAAISNGNDVMTQAGSAARAYLDFATNEANLNEVMYRHDADRNASAISLAASGALAPLGELFESDHDEAATTATLFLATLQGIAGLVNCGVVSAVQVPQLVSDALPRFFPPPAHEADPA